MNTKSRTKSRTRFCSRLLGFFIDFLGLKAESLTHFESIKPDLPPPITSNHIRSSWSWLRRLPFSTLRRKGFIGVLSDIVPIGGACACVFSCAERRTRRTGSERRCRGVGRSQAFTNPRHDPWDWHMLHRLTPG